MSSPITPKYTKEQLKKVYNTLPAPLKEALGSVEIQDEIDEICRQNGITDAATIQEVYDLSMDVFMGLIQITDFEGELGEILKEKKDATQEVAHRIRRFVLFPLKAEIEQLHAISERPILRVGSERPAVPTPRHSDTYSGGEYMVRPEESGEEPEQPEPEQPRKEAEKDPYRETTE